MTFLETLRRRLSPSEPSASGGAAQDAAAEAGQPFAGYDHLATRKVVGALSDHSQVELEAVEAYERAHKNREPVLDKLRYMRGSEPLPGYDALSVDEIIKALETDDKTTIKRIRAYERKFANRPDVLDAVDRARHRSKANLPAPPAPGYQPTSAR
jgi:hypothetical protein